MTRGKNEGSPSGDLRISTGVNEMKWRQREHGQKPRRQNVRFTVGGEQNERCGEESDCRRYWTPKGLWESQQKSEEGDEKPLEGFQQHRDRNRVLLSTSTFRLVRAGASPEVLSRQQKCSEPRSHPWLLSFSLTPLPNPSKRTSSTFKYIFRSRLLPSLLLLL